jgi:hypothetical protein
MMTPAIATTQHTPTSALVAEQGAQRPGAAATLQIRGPVMRLIRVTLVLATGLLCGCGAILHGTRQDIDVQSSPAGAKVETAPPSGMFTTPARLSLERKNSYVLTFTSAGYSSATVNINRDIGLATVVSDVLLTGLLGVAIDWVTGAWFGLSPEYATVTLTRTASGPGPDVVRVHVGRSRDGRGIDIISDAPGVQVKVNRQ